MPATICASRGSFWAGSTPRCNMASRSKSGRGRSARHPERRRTLFIEVLRSAQDDDVGFFLQTRAFLLKRDDGAAENLANLAKNIFRRDAELAIRGRALEKCFGSLLVEDARVNRAIVEL